MMPGVSFVLNSPFGPAQSPTKDLDLLRLVGIRPEDIGLNVVPLSENSLKPCQVLHRAGGSKVVAVHRETQVPSGVNKVAWRRLAWLKTCGPQSPGVLHCPILGRVPSAVETKVQPAHHALILRAAVFGRELDEYRAYRLSVEISSAHVDT